VTWGKDLLKIYGLVLGAAFVVLPVFLVVELIIYSPALGIFGICIALLPFIAGSYILYYLLKKKVTPSPYYYMYSNYNYNPNQAYGYGYQYYQPAYGYQPYGYQPYGYQPYGYQPAYYGYQPQPAYGTYGSPYYPPQQPVAQPTIRSEILPSEKDGQEEKLDIPDVKWLLPVLLIAIVLGFLALLGMTATPGLVVLFIPCFVVGFSFPSLIWISYVYSKDIYEPEPARVVMIAMTWGMLSTIPSLIFEVPSVYLPASMAWMSATIVAPFVEEAFKPMILPFLRIKIDDELDGIIYGVTAGMGFAIMENLNYEMSAIVGTSAVWSWSFTTLARGLASTVIHAVGAGIIGYAYARYVMKKGSMTEIAMAYLFAVGLHMTWNGTLSALEPAISAGDTMALYGQITFMVIWPCIEFIILRIALNKAMHLDEELFGPMGARPFGKPKPVGIGVSGAAPTGPSPGQPPSGPPQMRGPPLAQTPPQPSYQSPPGYGYQPPPPPTVNVPERARAASGPPRRPDPGILPARIDTDEDFDEVVGDQSTTPKPPRTYGGPPPPPDHEEIILDED